MTNGVRAVAAAMLAALLSIVAIAAAPAPPDGAGVELLKHPFPFEASLTILADLHSTTIDEFEAVHHLVNTRDEIRTGTNAWTLLGLDSWADADGRKAVTGFGFPFADAFLFYDPSFGWFSGYDESAGRLVPSKVPGLETKFLEWYRLGYVGPIHTYGSGHVTRAASTAATNYLLGKPNSIRPFRVWVNHSKAVTPAGVGGPCCRLLTQLLVEVRYRAFRAVGRGASLAEPDPLPGHMKAIGFLALGLIACGSVCAVALLVRGRRLAPAVLLLIASALTGGLWSTQVDFYQGDNPGSPYFDLDEVRRLGIRYYWTVNSDYWHGTTSEPCLAETAASTGRPTMFEPQTFGDGSRGLMFRRNTIATGPRTLRLLSGANLDRLESCHGRAVLYLHWLTNPKAYFTRDGVQALQTLADRRERIWTPSADELLAQAYAYSYLQYSADRRDGHVTVDITGFDDPITGHRGATLAELANISFKCDNCRSIGVSLNGAAVADDSLATADVAGGRLVTIRPSANVSRPL